MTDAAPAPVATIVVAAWRMTRELRDCLDALANLDDAPAFEVIVVVNGSSAEVREIVHAHPVVTRAIDLDANVGFGAACNLAARDAAGEFLVFLNDDTRVDPRWLSSLVATATADPRRVIVSSLLLNADGTVQEAGSRLRADGGTRQFGKGLTVDAARDAGLLEAREVDYGSGAALLVRAEWFRRVGGFDPIFEPAYFEDVDLALRIAEAGGVVWFEPAATVAHHSGSSTSNDPWFRKFAADRAGTLFIDRWGEVLSHAADENAPVTATIPVPRAERPPAEQRHVADDDLARWSTAHADDVGRQYARWLADHLDHEAERNEALSRRVRDLEARGPIGVLKSRVGIWLASRRRS